MRDEVKRILIIYTHYTFDSEQKPYYYISLLVRRPVIINIYNKHKKDYQGLGIG